MKILITGGSGFVGQHLLAHLFEKYADLSVVNLDLVPSKYERQNLSTIILDLRDREQLVNLEEVHFDYCIHLAALCKEPGFEWEEYFQTNDRGTKNLLEYLEKCKVNKIAFTSTMMVYKAGEHQKKETDLSCPDTAYGISKLLAEREIEKWANKSNDRNYFTVRPSVIFGENENANFTRLYDALKNKRFAYVGRKTTVKSCVYVKEVCNALEYSYQNNIFGTFNFAFEGDSEIGTIVDSFKKVFGFRRLWVPVIPYKLLKWVAKGFQVLNSLGLKNGIHPRRIEKLYFSTNISPQKMIKTGYKFQYNLISALEDWKKESCKFN